ncbi:hypothetical protein BGX26_007524 [Mortierella sp. AD094]|nr:hypothetical protein BGX26_007524 [Mortierella sp. AD094]
MVPWYSWLSPTPLSPPFPPHVHPSQDVDSAAKGANEDDIEFNDWDDFGDFDAWDDGFGNGDSDILGYSSSTGGLNDHIKDSDNTMNLLSKKTNMRLSEFHMLGEACLALKTHMFLKTHVLHKTHMLPKIHILDRAHVGITRKLMCHKVSPIPTRTMLNEVFPLLLPHKTNTETLIEVR